MIILGISEAHEAHACVVRDGRLLSAVAEERFTRIKADSRYPRRSIDAALRVAGIAPDEIDAVAFASKSDWIWQTIYNKHAEFSVRDWIDECEFYWKPVLLEGRDVSPFALIDRFIDKSGPEPGDEPYFPLVEQVRHAPREDWGRLGDAIRHKTVEAHLGVSQDRVHIFRHEDCHKAHGFYSSPYGPADALVLTIEGGGDDSSATVSTMTAGGEITELWRSNDVQAGRLYAYVTLILGMKPGQHEYKVMGLAPYGTEYHGQASLDFFRCINRVEGIGIVNDRNVPDLYYSVREALEGQRFDGIAWGLQAWLEELLCTWVANALRETGLKNLVLSGGVAQNIKAVKAIAALDEVERIWAGPISGDGSIAIGAAWLASRKLAPEHEIEGLKNIYLGTWHETATAAAAVRAAGLASKYRIIERPGVGQVAQWLADGHVVARFSGRMEFGQRALGNRSILADPRRGDSVERVNRKIKYRDFWMPFTPSMTFEAAEHLLDNPGGHYSPYMTMAFDMKPGFAGQLPAVVHPADKTARPQMLKREDNPGYHDLLQAFGRISGFECLMNTSFNLHGDAIAESPEDAIRTFENSELDILLFDELAIARVDVA